MGRETVVGINLYERFALAFSFFFFFDTYLILLFG